MNDGPTHNAFDRNHAKVTEFTPKKGRRRSNDRVRETDIPDFDFDVEEPPEGEFTTDSAMGVDRSLGNYADLLRHTTSEPFADDVDAPLTMPPFEFDEGGAKLPPPEVFNAYPPEVQRKIMEWTDRDLRARRDDESRRQDAILRANIARDRTRMIVPVVIVILAILCAAITGLFTKNAIFVISFLVVALAIVIALAVSRREQGKRGNPRPPYTNI